MGQQLDLAKNRLFGKDALAVKNVKLYPGTNRETTSEEFAEQINKALSQLESGDFDEVDFENGPA